MEAQGRAALEPRGSLQPYRFERRDPLATDVVIEILHCGICHTDIHFVDNDFGYSFFPLVPGHEIVGRVTAVGSEVTKFQVGDLAGVGCLVDSCRQSAMCQQGEEHVCEKVFTPTYGGYDRVAGQPTYGGYSNIYVVDEHFALRLRDGVDPAATAPLLCAGITTYSPLRHWGIGPGHTLGVVGLGGLGHMAVKLGSALGAAVVVFTTSASKCEDARRLGADEVVLSTDRVDMQRHRGSIDFMLDTVAAAHDLHPLVGSLKRDGTLCLVGMPEEPLPINVATFAYGRKRVAGSLIGGIAETQEMLDFCADHGIVADIEPVGVDAINDAYSRMLRSDVKYRFVIDMATMPA